MNELLGAWKAGVGRGDTKAEAMHDIGLMPSEGVSFDAGCTYDEG